MEGGRDIEVTETNKSEFVDKMLHWRLVDRVAAQMDALVAGVYVYTYMCMYIYTCTYIYIYIYTYTYTYI